MKPDQIFQNDPVKKNLRSLAIQGVAVSVGSQGVRFVMTLGTTAVLARFLTPEDFGLIGMVWVIIGFGHLFRDLGMSSSTVQKEQISHNQVSNLFWLNVILSAFVSLLLVGLAPAIAWVYKEPRLFAIVMVMAGGFFVEGLSAQHAAVMRRRIRLGRLALAELVGQAAGAGAGIAVAMITHSYWALVVKIVVANVITVAGVCSLCGWRPSLPRQGVAMRSMIAFGGRVGGANIITYLMRSVDNFLIGVVWGGQSLGLYAKSYQLLLIPAQQINAPLSAVMLPALSRLQGEPERFRAWYRKALISLAMVTIPIFVFLFVFAEGVVALVLGDQWSGAIPIFRALAPAAFVSATNVATGWAYLSLGHVDRLFRWSLFAGAITLASFCVGIFWGALGVAIAYSTVTLLIRVPALIYCYKSTPLRLGDFLDSIWRPFVLSIFAGSTAYVTSFYFFSALPTTIFTFLFGAVIFGFFYLATYSILPLCRGDVQVVRELVALFKAMPLKQSGT